MFVMRPAHIRMRFGLVLLLHRSPARLRRRDWFEDALRKEGDRNSSAVIPFNVTDTIQGTDNNEALGGTCRCRIEIGELLPKDILLHLAHGVSR
jgi:hypothetical protein